MFYTNAPVIKESALVRAIEWEYGIEIETSEIFGNTENIVYFTEDYIEAAKKMGYHDIVLIMRFLAKEFSDGAPFVVLMMGC